MLLHIHTVRTTTTVLCSHSTGKDDSLAITNNGLTHAVVVKLLEGLEHRGHHIYTDNYYTSPALFADLFQKGFGACGTVRVDRRGVPHEMRCTVRKGDVVTAAVDESVTALKWMDKRPVVMLSSIHDSSMVAKRRRSRLAPGGTDEVMKPKMIEEYNNKMGGVDKSDQLLSYYGFPHRTVKWWKRAFYHLVDLAIVQAYTLYRQSSQAGRHLSHQQFRIQLAKELLHSAGEVAMSQVSPHSHPPIAWLTERHFPDRTELNANGKFLQPDCVVCSRKRGSPRKTTSYICKQCDLPMCITPCFELYHTKVDPLRYL